MPSLNTFYIEFDRPNAVYIPGDVVSGYVIISLAREKIAEELKVRVKGEANVSWYEQINTRDAKGNMITTTINHSANEKYFSLTVSLLERSPDDRKVHLPAGFNRYPFSIQLPGHIPCSFEHNFGYIRYTIKATVVRSWRFDHECKSAFTIITPYDLNIRRELCIGIYDEVNQAFSYCCCCSNGSINMNIKLPTTGFVPGQWVEIIFDIKETNEAELQKICVKLEQCIEFRATTSTKMENTNIATVEKIGPFDKRAIIVSRLLIPSVPPSELEFCGIIHLKYVLHLALYSGTFSKITRKYPILIGTIPLMPVPSAPVPSSSSYASTSMNGNMTSEFGAPSAPVTESYDPPPSYEECCTNKASSIKDPKESTFVYGANEPFAPKYPVFKFPT